MIPYYDPLKKSVRCNGNINHIFKRNRCRDVQILYQDKPSTEMTLNEFKFLTSTCGREKYQPLTIIMTKNR